MLPVAFSVIKKGRKKKKAGHIRSTCISNLMLLQAFWFTFHPSGGKTKANRCIYTFISSLCNLVVDAE